MLLIVVLALIAALSLPSLVSAGGWVVITLDTLPQNVVAGEPVTVGMMARQHGVRAWETQALHIQAKHIETGKTVVFSAFPDLTPGHYTAEMVFSQAGSWEWSIGAGMFPDAQPMPALEVSGNSAAATGETNGAVAAQRSTPSLTLIVSALAAFAVGVMMIVRSGSRKLPMLTGVGLILLCAGLVFATFPSVSALAQRVGPQTVTKPEGVEPQAVLGQQLFLAKGCIICHANDRAITVSESYGVSMGPNLTNYRNDPVYLHTLLKDPQAVRPEAAMPNLALKVEEIDALVAFLNHH